jgi:serine/threonine-protein kinase RsbW
VSDTSPSAARHARFAADAAAVQQAADALDVFCAEEGVSRQDRWPLQVALDEILTNVVSHARDGAGSAIFDVWFRRVGDDLEVVVADDGPAFDPLSQPAPDVTLPLEKRQPGGLGIMLVKTLLDEVRYERTTRNVVTLRKRMPAGGVPGEAGPDEHSAERA